MEKPRRHPNAQLVDAGSLDELEMEPEEAAAM